MTPRGREDHHGAQREHQLGQHLARRRRLVRIFRAAISGRSSTHSTSQTPTVNIA